MKDPTVFPAQDIYYPPDQQPDKRLYQYSLKWRQRQLLVKLSQQVKRPQMLSLKSKQRLVECLNHSPVRLLRLDPSIDLAGLWLWANACEQSKKPVFLQIHTTHALPRKRSPFSWWLKRLIDWSASAILLLVLSPVMLGLVLLMCVYSPGSIFVRQWHVGERGKIFRLLKFRTIVMNTGKQHQVMVNRESLHKGEDEPQIIPLGRWMQKYKLDQLPQLFNVLRGEMSLVGPRPRSLHAALRLSPEGKRLLNALPGIIGAWQVEARSTLLDLEMVNSFDLKYLHNWSLWRDLKILLLTIPKVVSGFGA